MEDCIKIEEIKMFLDTDLSCQFENPRWEEDYQQRVISDKLKGIIGNDIYIEDEILGLEEIMPLVKPLSSITKKEFDIIYQKTEGLYFRHDDIDIDDYEITFNINDFQGGGSFTTSEMLILNNELAKRHYDIFNWIGRGLANELN